jgi:hypothetical protein
MKILVKCLAGYIFKEYPPYWLVTTVHGYNCILSDWGTICTDFPGIAPVLWALQSQMSQVFPSHKKYNISDSAYKHFDCPTLGILPDLAAGSSGFKACVVSGWQSVEGQVSYLYSVCIVCDPVYKSKFWMFSFFN